MSILNRSRMVRVSMESAVSDVQAELAAGEIPVTATVVTEPEVIVVPSASTDELALAKIENEVTDTVSATSELVAAGNQLDDIRARIGETLVNGGLTAGEAQAYSIAVESISLRLGITGVVPSMESFGGSMDRVEATMVTMEGVGKTLQKIGVRLLALMKRAGEKVMAFLKRLVSSESRFAARVDSMRKAVENKKFNVTQVKIPGALASKLMIGNSVPSNLADTAKASANKLRQELGAMSDVLNKNSQDVAAFNFNELANNADAKYEEVKMRFINLTKVYRLPWNRDVSGVHGSDAKATEYFIGNRYLWYRGENWEPGQGAWFGFDVNDVEADDTTLNINAAAAGALVQAAAALGAPNVFDECNKMEAQAASIMTKLGGFFGKFNGVVIDSPQDKLAREVIAPWFSTVNGPGYGAVAAALGANFSIANSLLEVVEAGIEQSVASPAPAGAKALPAPAA